MIKMDCVYKEFRIEKNKSGFSGFVEYLFNRQYETLKAVKNLNLEIEEGEVVGYIGTNGAGKSTTIKLLTGILSPTHGSITVNGIDPFKNRKHNAKNIGVVFGQRNQLYWDLPVKDSFEFNRSLYSISNTKYNERINLFNESMNLGEIFNKPVRKLSLGQRMRANVALAFLHNPKIVYLDEPTIGLDIVTKDKIRDFIKLENSINGTTILFTSHDMNDIKNICNRLVLLDKGEIQFQSELTKFIDQYGKHNIIEVLGVKSELLRAATCISEEFNINDDDLVILNSNENSIKFRYNKKIISSSKIIEFFIKRNIEISNFTITETNLEDIIRDIYTRKVEI